MIDGIIKPQIRHDMITQRVRSDIKVSPLYILTLLIVTTNNLMPDVSRAMFGLRMA